jgi:uncharacterized repeat protein (TIGR03803 family)
MSGRRAVWTKVCRVARTSAVLATFAGLPLAQGQKFKTLYSFTGGNDGGIPQGPLLLDKKGNLYGAAFTSANGFGNGTVFKVNPTGKFRLLFAFPGQGGNGNNGANPVSGVARDDHGNIYGAAQLGGQYGIGVVFKVSPTGQETVLRDFSGPDGAVPNSAFIRAPSGGFYSSAFEGGDGKCRDGLNDCGLVFSIDESGNYQIIYQFQGQPRDGFGPWLTLVQDAQGNLYGAGAGGGDLAGMNCYGFLYGCGAIFKLSPNSDGTWTETLLHSFTGGSDGDTPTGVAVDSQGNVYGTSLFGAQTGCGAVFKIDAAGNFTILHSFTGNDGCAARGVALDQSGNLYGATAGGGKSGCPAGCGVVYRVDAQGTFKVLHAFDGSDGGKAGVLIVDGAGTLYGTTIQGGASDWGTIFKLKP